MIINRPFYRKLMIARCIKKSDYEKKESIKNKTSMFALKMKYCENASNLCKEDRKKKKKTSVFTLMKQ